MSVATLTVGLQGQITQAFGNPKDADELQKFCKAIATAVIMEIEANGVVEVTVTGTLPLGPEAAEGIGNILFPGP